MKTKKLHGNITGKIYVSFLFCTFVLIKRAPFDAVKLERKISNAFSNFM